MTLSISTLGLGTIAPKEGIHCVQESSKGPSTTQHAAAASTALSSQSMSNEGWSYGQLDMDTLL
jgi:hypothetical protein